MNTTQYAQGISAVNFAKWFFATILTVVIGVFLTLLVGWRSVFSATISLWLTTSLFSCWAQISIIRSTVPIQVSRWLRYLACSSIIGWAVSFLVLYLLKQPMESWINSAINSADLGNVVWAGFFAGGVIGLFPGILIGLAYWWLTRPDDSARRLLVNNVISWCLGMGIASAALLILLTVIISSSFPVF